MRRRKLLVLMRIASWILLAMAALVALCYAMGLGGHDSALVVLALIFEITGLGCWWVSAGKSR